MIMVDELKVWPTAWGPFRAGSCHLTTDGTVDELHAFAARLGLRRSWFQHNPLAPHYDLVQSKRELALELGAVFVTARDQAKARIEARRARYGDALAPAVEPERPASRAEQKATSAPQGAFEWAK